MHLSSLVTYRIGPYLVTEKCPQCRRSHAAGPSRVIVHDSDVAGAPGVHERVRSSRVPIPADVKRALASYSKRKISLLDLSIHADAEAGKLRKRMATDA